MTELLHLCSTALAFLVVVNLLVFVHEIGHYIVARCFRIRIETISIGVGRQIACHTAKNGVNWRVGLWPVGGYVRLAGPEAAPAEPDRLRLFETLPLAKRAIFMAAGPAANFALAVFLFAMLYTTKGLPAHQAEIVKIIPGSPAEAAGIQPGDHFVSVDGTQIHRFEDVVERIERHPGDTMTVVLERGGAQRTTQLTPHVVKVTEPGSISNYDVRIGITSNVSLQFVPQPPVQALGLGVTTAFDGVKSFAFAIRQVIEGKRPAAQMGGSVQIAHGAGSAVRGGIGTLTWFSAVLSVSMGLFNLLPIPVLDGGNLLFYAVEAITRKPPGPRFVRRTGDLGILALGSIIFWSVRNDLLNLFFPGSR